MKTFLFSFFLMAMPLCSTMAQTFLADELTESLLTTLKAERIETIMHRSRDSNDSLCMLSAKTFTHPYALYSDAEKVNAFIEHIQSHYDRCQENADFTYCVMRALHFPYQNEENIQVKMFYRENVAPFVVGGTGHNVAIIVHNNRQNPIYRRADGIEWWLDAPESKVYFRVFCVKGRKSESAWQTSATSSATDVRTGKLQENLDSAEWQQLMLQAIENVTKMYGGGDDEFSRAAAKTAHISIENYLKQFSSGEDLKKLFRVLGDNPYCCAELISPDETKQIVSLGKLAEILDSLNVLCHSYENFDSLSKKELGSRASLFLYQVFLNEHVDVSE